MQEQIVIRNIEDIKNIEKVPLRERVTTNSTYELIQRGAQDNLDTVALYFLMSGETWESPMPITYREFLGRITQTANLLNDLGIRPRDVTTFILPNLPHTHFAIWGGEAAGIVNPINPMLEPAQIRDIMNSAKSKALITLGEYPGSDIWQKVEAIRKEVPTLEAIIRVMGPSDEANGIYGFDEVIEKYNADKLDSGRSFQADEVCSLYHTGGTTGTPKLAMRTHMNEMFSAVVCALGLDMARGTTMMFGLPLFHANAPLLTGLAPFSVGASVVMLSPTGYRDPGIIRNFFKIAQKYRVNSFMTVPTVLSMLLDIPNDGIDLSSLRYAMCGAAPLSVQVFREFEKRTGLKLLEGYGLTEGTVVSSNNPRDGERKIGSVGLRIPYQEMKTVVLDENGSYVRDCKTDEIGVVAVRGPNVFKGYVEEAHNKGAWLPGGWLNTGDMGRMDKDEYLWLTGRKKELIIRGGHNIDPAVIEEVLYKIDDVALAAAVGRPDKHAGEVPVAYVVPKPGAKLEAAEIENFCREHIVERAAMPKKIKVIDTMPLTGVGKIFKPALRYDAIKDVFQADLQAIKDLAQSVDVVVKEDKVHGTLAIVTVKPAAGASIEKLRNEINSLLGQYTVRYEVIITT
ncbi:MAG: acyl-CoA synthetase [Candidatus Abyssobacteria bacterium SURF_5]|uniref:Acyl-CoA synthetase n=1 Tax=Abyssobacteria bacterium (strain SURF_5) TaxID=2093360 RepID=A0A3A4P0Z7_ABYX5|nr:MAG: acyl-CoA synthetase [Candidatus Abyssubacteria bacterium SURF_5]